MMHGRSTPRWLLHALTACLATVVALAAAEGALRIASLGHGRAWIDYQQTRREQQYQDGDGTGFGAGGYLKEGFDAYVVDGYGGTVRWRNNADGFRSDEEYALAKPPGTLRVLSLGDSFTAGYRVGQEQTYSYRLEQALRKDGRFGRAEVLIAVLEEPTMELEYLQTMGLRYEPDIVLLGITLGNDIAAAYATQSDKGVYRFERTERGLVLERKNAAADYEEWKKAEERIEIALECLDPNRHNSRGPLWAMKNEPPRFRLLGLVRGMLEDHDAPQTVISNGENYLRPRLFDANGIGIMLEPAPEPMKRAYESTLATIEGFRDLCARSGVSLVVAIFPQRFQVQAADWPETIRVYNLRPSCFNLAAPNRRIMELCRTRGIDCIDLTDGLRASYERDRKSLYLPLGDMHWNARGHAAAAELLSPIIASRAAERAATAAPSGLGLRHDP